MYDAGAELQYYASDLGWWGFWMYGWGSWFYWALLIWMLVYCIRNDPERYTWLWVILIFQPLGAIIYFFARWLPSKRLEPPPFLGKWTRGSEIRRLKIAASQIGKPHQYNELAEALQETGQTQEAGAAYRAALEKDGKNVQALWGAAGVDFKNEDYAAAREKLEKVLARDPSYKFGDVSLLYGKTLYRLGEREAAREQLEKHTKRWRHPEGVFLLATLCADAGEIKQAREHLDGLIMDIEASPRAIARKQVFWKARARKLLRRLPAA
ncbi:MAG: tetratricopeptide repeat protein [Maioricimonas sp. JB049]